MLGAGAMSTEDAPAPRFREKFGFLAVLAIQTTCLVHLMTFLRPILEQLLWAMFFVMALHPITLRIEMLI